MTLDPESRPRRADGVQGRDLADEYVFLDPAGDRLLVLNHSAREIYLACDGRRTPSAIAEHLADLYSVEPRAVQGDVDTTLASLAEAGLITH